MTAPAGAQTDSNGKRVYPVQGRPMPSANTALSMLDRPGLNGWKFKGIAYGVASDPELQRMALNGQEWKAAMGALDAIPPTASELGTAVHFATEGYDYGDDVDTVMAAVAAEHPQVDSEAVALHLLRWIEARAEFGIIPTHIERTVAHAGVGYAGTLDRACHFRYPEVRDLIHAGCDRAHVLDVKTGSKVWPDVALQLSAYANATHWWDAATDTVTPIDGELCTDVGIVAALHSDDCAVYPVALHEAWVTYCAAMVVWQWNEEHKPHVVGPALSLPTVAW